MRKNHFILKDDKPTQNLMVGDEIKVLTLFGQYIMFVEEHKKLKELRGYTADRQMMAWLTKDKDGYWTSLGSCNPNEKVVGVYF